jgi:site-specific recombinase XerD
MVRDFVPVHREACKVFDDWLDAREDEAQPIFIRRTGRRLSRREAAAIIQHTAAQANGRLSEEEKIDVSPHILRHTFLLSIRYKAILAQRAYFP